jgi:hypothetical protein
LQSVPLLRKECNSGTASAGAFPRMQPFLTRTHNAPPQVDEYTYRNIGRRAARAKVFHIFLLLRVFFSKSNFDGKSQKDGNRSKPEKPRPEPEKIKRENDEGLQRIRRIKKGGRPPKGQKGQAFFL